MDTLDRQLIVLTQQGLPLSLTPYADLAQQLQLDEAEVLQRLQRMLDRGIIRRIAVVPNHYRLGYRFNAMSVWDVDDTQIMALGERVATLTSVSHCYQRPRHLPDWPYNLFAMLHGKQQDSVERQADEIEALLGNACRSHELLYSERILKKTGLRIDSESEQRRTACSV